VRTKTIAVAWLIGLGGLVAAQRTFERAALAQGNAPPKYEVDPFWPKMPPQWILGQVAGLSIDAQDHIWILQRPWSLNPD